MTKFSQELFPVDYSIIPQFYDEFMGLMSNCSIHLQISYQLSGQYLTQLCSIQSHLLLHVHHMLRININDLRSFVLDICNKSMHLLTNYANDKTGLTSEYLSNIKTISALICSYFKLLHQTVTHLQNASKPIPLQDVMHFAQHTLADVIHTIPELRLVHTKMMKLGLSNEPENKTTSTTDTQNDLQTILHNQKQLFFQIPIIRPDKQQPILSNDKKSYTP